MNLPQIRIVLVDDHELIRGSWKLLLKQNSRFTIIGECRNGAEAIEEAQKLMPDIMLMDINMTPINGLEATERIARIAPSIKIIGLSINSQPVYAEKMLQAGAQGYARLRRRRLRKQRVQIAPVHHPVGSPVACRDRSS